MWYIATQVGKKHEKPIMINTSAIATVEPKAGSDDDEHTVITMVDGSQVYVSHAFNAACAKIKAASRG